MLGEDGEEIAEGIDKSRSFQAKSVWARIAVIAAGPIFNFILAFVLAIILIGCMGFDKPQVGETVKGYPMAEAGMKEGDVILKLNGENINVYREISLFMQLNGDKTIDVTYLRDGEKHTATITPKYSKEAGYYLMGMSSVGHVKGNCFEVVKYSVYEVRWWIKYVVKSQENNF